MNKPESHNASAPCEVVMILGGGDGVGASIDRGHRALLEQFQAVHQRRDGRDGQMNPDDLERLVQPIVDGRAITSRKPSLHEEGYNLCLPIVSASTILSWFTTLASQRPLGPQCGFTATSHTVLRDWDWERSWSGYGYPNFWLINLPGTDSASLNDPCKASIEKRGASPSIFGQRA